MQWDAHWLCGIVGCDDEMGGCPSCGCGVYDYGFVFTDRCVLRWWYSAHGWIASRLERAFTVRRCYGECKRVLSWRNRYGHCGKDDCEDIPF